MISDGRCSYRTFPALMPHCGRRSAQIQALARYHGDRGFERNLQVREQVKSADDTPLIPGSSLKGAIRTALAFAALEEMEQDERQALGQSLERILGQAEEAKRRRNNRYINRLKERIGQEIEQAIFRCGAEQRGRISYGDIHYDLMRAVSISDTYDAQAELIVAADIHLCRVAYSRWKYPAGRPSAAYRRNARARQYVPSASAGGRRSPSSDRAQSSPG